jgi:hypothetical protein
MSADQAADFIAVVEPLDGFEGAKYEQPAKNNEDPQQAKR